MEEKKTAQQETNGTETESQERTFTQSEVNAIINDRLQRDRAKYADYDEIKAKAAKFDEAEEASKSELQKMTEKASALEAQIATLSKEKEVREVREKVAKETNVPLELLTGSTEEECKVQAERLLAWNKPDGYPKLKDGGEVNHTNAGTNAQKFARWLDAN